MHEVSNINYPEVFKKHLEQYKSDPIRQAYINQMVKIHEMHAAPNMLFNPVSGEITHQLPEATENAINQVKKALLAYDFKTYPGLLIKVNWKSGECFSYFSFEYQHDENRKYASQVYRTDEDDLDKSMKSFINYILNDL